MHVLIAKHISQKAVRHAHREKQVSIVQTQQARFK